MTEEKVFKRILDEIINMWQCNYDNGSLAESFEGWCEDGEIFNDDDCIPLMERVAPFVDMCSNALQSEWNKCKEHNNSKI